MIRRAQKKDLDAVDRLLSQVLEIHAKIRPDLFIPGTRKYTDDELLRIFEDDQTPVFVYEDEDGRVCGYCFCVIEEPKESVNMYPVRSLYIDDLCVDADCRGAHVGSKLYHYVLEYAKELACHSVTLNVWEGNDEARAFYKRMGMGVRKTKMEAILHHRPSRCV
jgi:ribosomal protein S18 acetylase RimI-like enzyme